MESPEADEGADYTAILARLDALEDVVDELTTPPEPVIEEAPVVVAPAPDMISVSRSASLALTASALSDTGYAQRDAITTLDQMLRRA